MANYPGAANSRVQNATPPLPQALYAGDTARVFNAEQPVILTASIAVALGLSSTEGVIPSLSVQGFFSGVPGVFEIDLQTSDIDADAFYQAEGAAIVAVDANNGFRAEFANVKAKFARLFIKARANAVNFTGDISR